MNNDGTHSNLLSRIAGAIAVSSAVSLWCWWATGAGLGLFLGTTILVSIFLPPLVLAAEGIGRIIILGGAIGATSLVWLAVTRGADVTPFEWLRCSIVLAGFCWAVAGVVSLMVAARISRPLSAALTIVLGLSWLGWPVWLSHALTQPLVNWLVPAHPLFAINSVLKHLGTWDRAPLAYNTLTALNQDVAYRLPTSLLPALVLHLALGTPGIWLSLRAGRAQFPTAVVIAPPAVSSAPPA